MIIGFLVTCAHTFAVLHYRALAQTHRHRRAAPTEERAQCRVREGQCVRRWYNSEY